MIEINNLTTNEIDEDFIKRVAEIVLLGENRKEEGISVVFVGAGRMRKLNKKYRKKNRVTDVLAFENKVESDLGIELVEQIPEMSENQLGEVVICLSEIKKNVKRYGVDYNQELARVLIHGVLHLLGYDHEKDKEEAKKMEKKQENYLSQALKSKIQNPKSETPKDPAL